MAPNFNIRIKAVEPERFHFALGVYGAAAAMQGPYPNPEEFSLRLIEDDGSVSHLQFTDRPANRGLLAVKKEFPDPEEFQSIGFRVMTFSEVIRNTKLVGMGLIRKNKDGDLEVHDAVINALAVAPFRKSGALDKSAFLALVKSEYKKLVRPH